MTDKASGDAGAALKPCPFCGEARTLDRDAEGLGVSRELGSYWVECDTCMGEGPATPTEAEAITAWNTRATQSRRPAEEIARGVFEVAASVMVDIDTPPHWLNYIHADESERRAIAMTDLAFDRRAKHAICIITAAIKADRGEG